jgi:hypothetical protein
MNYHQILVVGGCGAWRSNPAQSNPRRAVIKMTQHYIAGELSLLLARLQASTTGQPCTRDVARLRQEAELGPLTGLASVAVRALNLTDGLCWESLGRGDTVAFTRQAAVCAELHQLGVCAGLLEDT